MLFFYFLDTVLLSAIGMFVMRRIVLECSRLVRQFHLCNLVEESPFVVHGGWSIARCHNMASSGIEADTDNVRKTQEDEVDQISAKRMKTADSSTEHAVGIICSKF